MFLRLVAIWQILMSQKKSTQMSSIRDFLGHAYDLCALLATGHIIYGIKRSTLRKAVLIIAKALREECLSPADAAKVRGLLTWIDSGLAGRPCRGAMVALSARQHGRAAAGHPLTPELRTALQFFLLVLRVLPARAVPLLMDESPPVIIYSDAATLTSGLRLGAVIMELGGQAECVSVDVPEAVVERWELRTTYIGQGELICGPLALHIWPDRLRGRRLLWFVDNTAAVSAIAKACSPTADNSKMALILALQAAAAGALIWVEYVNTAQNPADPLSRGGLEDPVVLRRLASGEWKAKRHSQIEWEVLLNLNLEAAVDLVTTLGS